ncbi:MAG: serine/threonine protein kinase [Deltaproteobacteria bacterium]|jgi:hypothetical protein|nr:serine/threonine protein kinase [Deltaproteobacteria bacterium]MBW2496952.1 serine/threonine protein kinase [Deltaproteobacteria bacterium]
MATLLERHAWILPLAFALLLGATSFAAFRNLERAMMDELESRLVTLRDSSATAITIWAEEKRAQIEVLAADEEVREAALELIRIANEHAEPREALLAAPALSQLTERLRVPLERTGAAGYGVVTPSGVFAGTQLMERIGIPDPALLEVLLPMFEGKTILTRPLGRLDLGMIAGTGIRDDTGRVVGVFGVRIQPDQAFGHILSVARAGESGETYVFDDRGRLLSPSRFEDELSAIGLLQPGESSALNIQVRDPGGDMTTGFVPEKALAARPFTEAAASAIAGESAVNARGFRDYRGAEVVGAWTWIPELGVGLTSEIDRVEAYGPVLTVRHTLSLVMGLLLLGALGMFVYSFLAQRLRRQVDEARQLGRYRIESRIGKGGMGTVYLARHALLRRPTAIKVLNTERAGKEGIARFEREVQTTSALRHPNTVEIFDYGYTPDGTFYYAMEYLEGSTLSEIVDHDGPMPEARVLEILRQASGSIAEAHEAGLIHRDLKPANLMLCERGGLFDFVKVLDFGLVRDQNQTKDAALTDVASLTGTPLFMPPEAVRAPETLDAQGDVYQLGLIGYYLLTGRHLFTADTPMDVMLKHVHEEPVRPSEALGSPVSPDLEKLLLECLAKRPEDRPENAGGLLHRLEECEVKGRWTQADARRWWASWHDRVASWTAEDTAGSSTGSLPSGIDLAERTAAS